MLAAMDSTPSAIAVFDTVVLDCLDPHALAVFYQTLLGWQIVDDDADWVTIRDTSSTGTGKTGIAFQRADVFTAPTWPDPAVPQQAHIDFYVTDVEAAEKVALHAGATATGKPGDNSHFRVYLDPAGHPFCLCWSS